MLITTAQGNPSAAGAAILRDIKKKNDDALKKARAEEKAKQEKAAKEKAAKEKAAREKAAKEKAEREKTAQQEVEQEGEQKTPETTSSSNGNKMPSCPTTKPKDMSKLPPGWKKYEGMGGAGNYGFHCGYDGIKETINPQIEGRPQNECFYDDRGALVDSHHPYAGCAGSPNDYDASDKVGHAIHDRGGIRHRGPQGAATSTRKHADDAGRYVKEKANQVGNYVNEKWESVKGIFK